MSIKEKSKPTFKRGQNVYACYFKDPEDYSIEILTVQYCDKVEVFFASQGGWDIRYRLNMVFATLKEARAYIKNSKIAYWKGRYDESCRELKKLKSQ